MAQQYEYKVSFEYTNGDMRTVGGKKKVVPKNDYLTYATMTFTTYHDNQVRVNISKKLQEHGIKYPHIVNISIIEKTEI